MFVQQLAEPVGGAEALARSLAAAPGLAWLDGSGGSAREGRHSFLTAWPVEVLRDARAGSFSLLDQLAEPADAIGCGGWSPALVPRWIGYLAYDAPGLCFARYDALFAFDHEAGTVFVAGDDEAACARLLGRARTAEHQVAKSPLIARAGPVSEADPSEHARAIRAALELIARGEIYQVNLARRLWAPLDGPALALALAMRRESPVPLGMYFDDGERAVIARSMERFLRWDRASGRLYTRPIKGTRARTSHDADEQAELAADPKEHAEHAMIVDLMRNDLGRVAVVGTVQVEERFVVEPFARLHHLVSTVACTTRAEVRASDVLAATFPPGSVTGTPKLRAVQAIAELEPVGRGIYTGAVGFVDRAGGLSLAVAIRTAVVEAGIATYFAGGGIVEASEVSREIAETVLKARVFVDAVEGLVRAGGFEPP